MTSPARRRKMPGSWPAAKNGKSVGWTNRYPELPGKPVVMRKRPSRMQSGNPDPHQQSNVISTGFGHALQAIEIRIQLSLKSSGITLQF
jgi:hypothetical protein